MEDQNYELYHYGVQGMKWGIRRAQKKGKEYNYKSMGQKKYERKLAKQKARNASAKRLAKTSKKLEMFKERDRNRQDYAADANFGKTVAKQLLFGPFGSGNYSRMRSAGSGRLVSAFASNWVASTVGMPITILLSKSVENSAARRSIRDRERIIRMMKNGN